MAEDKENARRGRIPTAESYLTGSVVGYVLCGPGNLRAEVKFEKPYRFNRRSGDAKAGVYCSKGMLVRVEELARYSVGTDGQVRLPEIEVQRYLIERLGLKRPTKPTKVPSVVERENVNERTADLVGIDPLVTSSQDSDGTVAGEDFFKEFVENKPKK